jgi:hypothetical protein
MRACDLNLACTGCSDTSRVLFCVSPSVVTVKLAAAVASVAVGVDGNMIHIHFFLICFLLNTAADVWLLRQPIHWAANIILPIVGVIIFSALRRFKGK